MKFSSLINTLTYIGIVLAIVVVALGVGFGGWWLERKIHWSLSYSGQVQDTVKQMVKPECLK